MGVSVQNVTLSDVASGSARRKVMPIDRLSGYTPDGCTNAGQSSRTPEEPFAFIGY